MTLDAPLVSQEGTTVPFYQYLWKISSRCNLNCSYCYVYNLTDQRWRGQPKFMSEETARQTARRMREHLEHHNRKYLLISFHGGEPLLGGISHLSALVKIIQEELVAYGFNVRLSMQSNLTLLTEDLADFLLEHRISIGTSLDGPPEVNDLFRVDHQGRPSSEALERTLAIISRPKYRKIWGGILSVINPACNPVAVIEYFRRFNTPLIEFLYPLNHYDNMPPGKADFEATPYGDWLIEAFDHWWKTGAAPEIRIFTSILRLCCGLPSQVESLGLSVIDLVVVETNGDIEGLDSLKATFEGATVLSLNVFTSDFDIAARHAMVRLRQIGIDQLSETCKTCPVVKICGGGYIPHRYSRETGFANPSVYCRDLEKLIRHIHTNLQSAVSSLGGSVYDAG